MGKKRDTPKIDYSAAVDKKTQRFVPADRLATHPKETTVKRVVRNHPSQA